jgi:hypothetical protein
MSCQGQDKMCNLCGTIGHISKVCHSQHDHASKVNQCIQSPDSEPDDSTLHVFYTSSSAPKSKTSSDFKDNARKKTVTCGLVLQPQGIKLPVVADTASDIPLMSEKTLDLMRPYCHVILLFWLMLIIKFRIGVRCVWIADMIKGVKLKQHARRIGRWGYNKAFLFYVNGSERQHWAVKCKLQIIETMYTNKLTRVTKCSTPQAIKWHCY